MSKHFANELNQVEQELLAMSSKVEEMIEKSCSALRSRQPEIASEVVAFEDEINKTEVEIEQECLRILTLHQPVATDLRRLATIVKINNDLERIADIAVNITERCQSLAELPVFEKPERLTEMASIAVEMLGGALDAFVKKDADLARQICHMDDDVDQYNRQVIDELRVLMISDSSLIEASLHVFSASRHIERIADHATNIAEDVIYLVEGDIVRHQHDIVS